MTTLPPGKLALRDHELTVVQTHRSGRLPGARVPVAGRRSSGRLRAFRPDVEGLRAIAVLVVVGYHAALPGLPGGFVGVDVFFVISGFLITRHLLAEVTTRGRVDVVRFWSRRVRRLMPAAALVTVATVLSGWLLLDPLASRRLNVDALYTAGYAVNWHLAQAGTNYLTATQSPSALQHYWSLAVEEQYYLLWPLILLAVAVATRRRSGVTRVRVITVILAAGTAVSLGFCVWQTHAAEPWAYFGTPARAWELGVGGLLAVAAGPLSRLPAAAAAGLSWAGMAGVLYAVTQFGPGTAFPGAAAALPAAGAAAVIAGGCAAPAGGAELLLGRSGPQVLGALSYGWYLWHWPMLVLAPALVGHPLDMRHRVLVCLLALGAAAVSYALLEHPIRGLSWPNLHPGRFLGVGGALAAAVALITAAVLVTAAVPVGSGAQARTADLGGRDTGTGTSVSGRVTTALRAGLTTGPVPSNLTPGLAAADTTVPQPQRDGCHASFAAVTPDMACVYGDPARQRTIVLFGDSHALQWFPALDRIAKADGYRLVSLTKSSCTPLTVTLFNETLKRRYVECDTWRARAIAAIVRLRPALVVVSTLTGVLDHGLDGGGADFDRAWAAGATRTVTALRSGASRVTVLDDTTNPGGSVPECVAGHLGAASACDYFRAGGLFPAGRRSAQRAAVTTAGAVDIDPTGWLCPSNRCPVIVGNLLVFRDDQHLSTAYADWLAVPLQERLRLPAA